VTASVSIRSFAVAALALARGARLLGAELDGDSIAFRFAAADALAARQAYHEAKVQLDAMADAVRRGPQHEDA
jgi:hypothetical protein